MQLWRSLIPSQTLSSLTIPFVFLLFCICAAETTTTVVRVSQYVKEEDFPIILDKMQHHEAGVTVEFLCSCHAFSVFLLDDTWSMSDFLPHVMEAATISGADTASSPCEECERTFQTKLAQQAHTKWVYEPIGGPIRPPGADWENSERYAEVGAIVSPHVNTDKTFGASVAMSSDSNVIVVGAPHTGSGEGAVYVYQKGDRSYSVTEITPEPDVNNGDAALSAMFGTSVAMDSKGDFLLVGTPKQDSPIAPTAGVVNLYYREHGLTQEWVLVQTLYVTEGESSDLFGSTIAVDDAARWIAIGAPTAGGNCQTEGGERGGVVYIFHRRGDGLTSSCKLLQKLCVPTELAIDSREILQNSSVSFVSDKQYLHNDYPRDGAGFGYALAMSPSGDALVVSAPHVANPGGLVFIYRQRADELQYVCWQMLTELTSIEKPQRAMFGHSITMDPKNRISVSSQTADYVYDFVIYQNGFVRWETLPNSTFPHTPSSPSTAAIQGNTLWRRKYVDSHTEVVHVQYAPSYATWFNMATYTEVGPYATGWVVQRGDTVLFGTVTVHSHPALVVLQATTAQQGVISSISEDPAGSDAALAWESSEGWSESSEGWSESSESGEEPNDYQYYYYYPYMDSVDSGSSTASSYPLTDGFTDMTGNQTDTGYLDSNYWSDSYFDIVFSDVTYADTSSASSSTDTYGYADTANEPSSTYSYVASSEVSSESIDTDIVVDQTDVSLPSSSYIDEKSLSSTTDSSPFSSSRTEEESTTEATTDYASDGTDSSQSSSSYTNDESTTDLTTDETDSSQFSSSDSSEEEYYVLDQTESSRPSSSYTEEDSTEHSQPSSDSSGEEPEIPEHCKVITEPTSYLPTSDCITVEDIAWNGTNDVVGKMYQMANLEHVKNSIIISNVHNWDAIFFPKLKTIGHSIDIDNTSIRFILAPELTHVGSIDIVHNHQLVTVNFTSLQHVSLYINVTNNNKDWCSDDLAHQIGQLAEPPPITAISNRCTACGPSNCLNGGTCESGLCVCTGHYEGEHCELKYATGGGECNIHGESCYNGGTCVDGGCECAVGFGGTFCEESHHCNDSIGMACANGGACVKGNCICRCDGWSGDRCEYCDPVENSTRTGDDDDGVIPTIEPPSGTPSPPSTDTITKHQPPSDDNTHIKTIQKGMDKLLVIIVITLTVLLIISVGVGVGFAVYCYKKRQRNAGPSSVIPTKHASWTPHSLEALDNKLKEQPDLEGIQQESPKQQEYEQEL